MAQTNPLQDFEDDDVDFGDVNELNTSGISDLRWERVRTGVDIRDLIYLLHSRRGSVIRCPFHGRDSKPSFNIYTGTNTAFCFGCPEGDGFWDTIKLVARTMDISRTKALRWLEREYGLPALAGEEPPDHEEPLDLDAALADEPEDNTILLEVDDLRDCYIRMARDLVLERAGDGDAVATARALHERFFEAVRRADVVPLARFVGVDAVRAAIKAKP